MIVDCDTEVPHVREIAPCTAVTRGARCPSGGQEDGECVAVGDADNAAADFSGDAVTRDARPYRGGCARPRVEGRYAALPRRGPPPPQNVRGCVRTQG